MHTQVSTELGDVVLLKGSKIFAGISPTGTFGCPDNTITRAGVATDDTNFQVKLARRSVGLVYNNDGLSSVNVNPDYILPGTPEDTFIVGYNGSVASNSTTQLEEDGRIGAFVNNVASSDCSEGDTLSAYWTADNSVVKIETLYTFGTSDDVINISTTLTNLISSDLSNVRFMRSFDPDNSYDINRGYITLNMVERQNPVDGISCVSATSLPDDSVTPSIYILSSDISSRVTTGNFAPTDCYLPYCYSGVLGRGTEVEQDIAICINFAVGTIAPSESATVNYQIGFSNSRADMHRILGDYLIDYDYRQILKYCSFNKNIILDSGSFLILEPPGSTPGILFKNIPVEEGATYRFIAYGSENIDNHKKSKSFLYVRQSVDFETSGSNDIIRNGRLINDDTPRIVDFVAPCDWIDIGILMSNARTGDRFNVNSVRMYKVNSPVISNIKGNLVNLDGDQRITGTKIFDALYSNTSVVASGAVLQPAGMIAQWANSSIPGGWLLCDGTTYPTTEYPMLASALGVEISGDNSFAVPNILPFNFVSDVYDVHTIIFTGSNKVYFDD